MEVRLTQLDSKFKCLFTAFVIVTEKSGLNTKIIGKKQTNKKNKRKMAAYLPELYKNNVGPAGDRRERCSVHSPNATK